MKFLAFLTFTVLLLLSHLKGNTQSCSLSCPPNIVINAESGLEGALVSFPPINSLGVGNCSTITYSQPNGSFFRIGSHSIIVTSSSGTKCAFTVIVTDNESPFLSEITLSKKILWPANNKMKKVAVYYTTSDNAQDVKAVLTVSSNATDGQDWEIVDDHMLRLKSSRLPDGSPRIYTITVTSSDEAGNKTTRTTTIAVSKTMTAVTGI